MAGRLTSISNRSSAALRSCSRGRAPPRTFRAIFSVNAGPRASAGAIFSGECFETLGVRPHLGRLLNRSDEAATGNAPGIVVSYTLWLRAFDGDRSIVGRSVLLNGSSVVVVGVAEPGFAGLSLDASAEFWVPMQMAPALLSPQVLTERADRRFRLYVRLARGVTAAQATDRLAAVAERLRVEDPQAWTGTTGSTREVTIGRELDTRLAGNPAASGEIATSMLGAIAAIVLMTCVNLATMIVARGVARTHELNVRLALGASRRRLLRQLATESLLISAGGIVAGVLIVAAALRVFDAQRPAEIPAFNFGMDWRVAGFAILAALLAPLVFGMAPGAHALRLAIAEGLRRRTSFKRKRLRLGPRELLLGVQVVVSFALLVVAALFLRALIAAPPGLPALPAALTLVPVDLSIAARSNPDMIALSARLLEAAGRVPGVDGVTAAALIPMTGSFTTVGGRLPDTPPEAAITLDANVVAPGYFELSGITLRSGRTFDARDHDRAPRVAVISESLARQLWNSTTVVGRSIELDNVGSVGVVGVVADVPYRSASAASHPVIYTALAQSPRNRYLLQARVRADGRAIGDLDRALRAVDARILIGAPMSANQFLELVRMPAKVTQAIGTVAGLLQLGLALMTTWGLVAYAVERRTVELAIRRALGATEAGIVQLIMRPSLWLLTSGAVIGCVAGAVAANALQAEFTGLIPIDLWVAVPAAVVVAAIVATAAWLPARRAARIEPAAALKQS